MKWVIIVGMVIMGIWVLMGTYPAFKTPLDAAVADITASDTLQAAMLGNLWWIMLILAAVGVISIWWTFGKK